MNRQQTVISVLQQVSVK